MKQVPFFANTPDDTHCYQAALKMILKYLEPEKDFTWEDLDTKTAKVKGLWTWPMAGLLWLQSRGYNVALIEDFDYQAFVNEGENYLIRAMGEEVGREQIDHSNIEQEKKYAEELLEKVNIEKRIPSLQDIKKYLNNGYLIICNVNSKKLNNESGYVGHFVVVYHTNDREIAFHDPGLPPKESRLAPLQLFEQAWSYPNETAKNIAAIKLEINT